MTGAIVRELPAAVIAIEGIDGSGKSTLATDLRRLGGSINTAQRWRGIPEFGSPIGTSLRQHLAELPPISKLYCFAAERHWILRQLCANSEPGLIVMDRYRDSAFACRAAEVTLGLAPPTILEIVHDVYANLPAPVFTVYLDVPIDLCLRRVVLRDGLSADGARRRRAYMEAQLAAFESIDADRQESAVRLTLADLGAERDVALRALVSEISGRTDSIT